MWSSGEQILVRRIVGGRIWFAHGATVVQDEPELVVFWLPQGAAIAAPEGEILHQWTLSVRPYEPASVLMLSPGDRAHALLADEHSLERGWYVNLETRTRTPRGIDIDDHYLDLWAYPDGRWEWLDEDELAEALEVGAITPEGAEAARAEGERVVAEWPFPTGWEDWRPPPEWEPPPLPEGWDVV
jgi:hypothetical protein